MMSMMMPRDISLNDSPIGMMSVGLTNTNPNTSSSREGKTVQAPARVSTTLLNRLPSNRRTKTKLPSDFKPGPYSVVLGRGKVNEFTGNRRLKVLASLHLQDYVAAKSRREKSYVVAKVMETVQQAAGGVGAFVRLEDGEWYEMEESACREKCGVILRDLCPAGQYRSATQNKVARRRLLKEERKQQRTSTTSATSAMSSTSSQPQQQQQQQQQTSMNGTAMPRMSIVNFDLSAIQYFDDNNNKNTIDNDDDSSLSDNSLAAFN